MTLDPEQLTFELADEVTGDLTNYATLDAPSVTAEINRLYAGGMLFPDRVVVIASNPASPLYRHIEWNDAAAATKWREHQGKLLIEGLGKTVTVERRVSPTSYKVSSILDKASNADQARAISAVYSLVTVAAEASERHGLNEEVAAVFRKCIAELHLLSAPHPLRQRMTKHSEFGINALATFLSHHSHEWPGDAPIERRRNDRSNRS
jgi:hypothetical protein